MPQTPKEKQPIPPEPERESSWEKHQAEHKYYYDDAHGYVTYDPEVEDCDEKDEESS